MTKTIKIQLFAKKAGETKRNGVKSFCCVFSYCIKNCYYHGHHLSVGNKTRELTFLHEALQ